MKIDRNTWPWIIIAITLLIIPLIPKEKNVQPMTCEELTRSHAVMWERQERLKQITCGYCHHKVPDWCDKHDGGVK